MTFFSVSCFSSTPLPPPPPGPESSIFSFSDFCPLSLDPFTAHREVSLTDGNRAASRTDEPQPYPDHPDRFDSWVQVLCCEGLVGRRYWEVEWDGQQVALGIAYNSVQRKVVSPHRDRNIF